VRFESGGHVRCPECGEARNLSTVPP
jgi:hypothetical protein